MTDAQSIALDAASVLLVDWPSREVPDALVRAGYSVTVRGGPEPDAFSVHELRGGEVVVRRTGPPEHVDLVYCHRPLDELPEITALAKELGAMAVWRQSGVSRDGAKDPTGCWISEDESHAARSVVEAAGLEYVDDTYIVDVVSERVTLPSR